MATHYFVDTMDPVIMHIGPLALHWYGLAYLAGFLAGYQLIKWLGARDGLLPQNFDYGDLVFWVAMGAVLGGRLGEVLFYAPAYYFARPLQIFAIWKGGMASHGGMIGVLVAVLLVSRRARVDTVVLLDLASVGATPGLFFGRLANFVNAELVGRVTDVPWAVIFPNVDMSPRHPVQLYQAIAEGPILGAVLLALPYRRLGPGTRLGAFMVTYALLRVVTESFREVDPGYLGLTYGWTNGQLLSLLMGAAGVIILLTRRRGMRWTS